MQESMGKWIIVLLTIFAWGCKETKKSPFPMTY